MNPRSTKGLAPLYDDRHKSAIVADLDKIQERLEEQWWITFVMVFTAYTVVAVVVLCITPVVINN